MSLNTPHKTASESEVVTHRAGWVLMDPGTLVADGYVRTRCNRIIEVGKGNNTWSNIIDHGPGVLMPCLVNAHTHLELSALKDQTDTESGFLAWVESVIKKREAAGEEMLVRGVVNGLDELLQSGSLLIGEIATLGLSFEPFTRSGISGIWFQEFLGSSSEQPVKCEKINFLKSQSVAGHAPHTTGSDLLVRLKANADNRGLPFSIHLAESVLEVEFLTTGKGEWADFLQQRNIDLSAMQLTGAGPVPYADHLGLLDNRTLAVHLVFANKKDYEILERKNVSVCLCPRSNLNLHQQLPDVPQMITSGLKLCLGTDSLASNDSLSLFDEMRFLAQSFPGISPKDILSMATVNGAEALGFTKDFGRIAPGYASRLIYLPHHVGPKKNILESIVYSDLPDHVSTIV